MNIVINSADILGIVSQLSLPPMVKVQAVSFAPGGSILVDGAIDLPVIGGFDAKLKLQAKTINTQTVRLRIIEAKASGFDLTGLVNTIVERLQLPGLTFHKDERDAYLQFVLPFDFVALGDINTDSNQLTVNVQNIDAAKLQAYQQAQAVKAADKSGSLAAQANLGAAGFHAQGTQQGIEPNAKIHGSVMGGGK